MISIWVRLSHFDICDHKIYTDDIWQISFIHENMKCLGTIWVVFSQELLLNNGKSKRVFLLQRTIQYWSSRNIDLIGWEKEGREVKNMLRSFSYRCFFRNGMAYQIWRQRSFKFCLYCTYKIFDIIVCKFHIFNCIIINAKYSVYVK